MDNKNNMNSKTKEAAYELSQKLAGVVADTLRGIDINGPVNIKAMLVFSISNLIVGVSKLSGDTTLLDYISTIVLENQVLEAEEKKNLIHQ